MYEATTPPGNIVRLGEKEFRLLGEFIHTGYGIMMPESKRVMLQSRLQARLRNLGLRSFSEYCEHVFRPENSEDELMTLVDIATTNKTDFFREPYHFDFLRDRVVPEFEARHGNRALRLWSAGCSRGKEPYTLAMVLTEHAGTSPGFDFSLLATDLSRKALAIAENATYTEDKAEDIPMDLRKKYLLKGTGTQTGMVRIVPELRHKVNFRRLNLMDEDYGIKLKMDVIFCRNVIIYFDWETQNTLINRLLDNLTPGGYLFLGHSETINWLDVRLENVAQTVYRKPKVAAGG